MMFRRADGSRPVDSEWHHMGKVAKRTTVSLSEWSEQDIERWDLEKPTREPTGRETRRTYVNKRPIDLVGINGFDNRDDPRK